MVSDNERLIQAKERYLDTERQFLEFVDIIPYHRNKSWTIYSPRLVNLLQSIGSQIEVILKIVVTKLRARIRCKKGKDCKNFPNMFKTLNKKGMLSRQKIMLQENRQILTPFAFTQRIPDWWDAYNKTKHYEHGIKSGTLKNVINAFAALSILYNILNIVMIRPPWKPQELKDFSSWKDIETVFDKNPQEYFFKIPGEMGDADANAKDLAHGYSGYDEHDWPSRVFYYMTSVADNRVSVSV